jgi:hypothetical protein
MQENETNTKPSTNEVSQSVEHVDANQQGLTDISPQNNMNTPCACGKGEACSCNSEHTIFT